MLFRQGDPSDLVYVVRSGEVVIYRERADGSEEPLDVVTPGRYFGELGPMMNLPRSASARAVSPAQLVGYSVREFRADASRRRTSRAFLRQLRTALREPCELL